MSEIVMLEVDLIDRVPVVRVIGEVDASNAMSVHGRLLDAVGAEGTGLVVDVTAMDYVDSAGIRMLFDVGERLRVRGMEMRLVAASQSFTADVLETVHITERIAVEDSVVPAVAAISDHLGREPAAD